MEKEMNVNVSLKKIVITIVTLLITGGAGTWFATTADDRAKNAELEILIKHAQRQALEIAIIEQASKLADYKKQLAAIEKEKAQSVAQPIAPIPPMTAPFMPAIPKPEQPVKE
jgi:hypothetical protein